MTERRFTLVAAVVVFALAAGGAWVLRVAQARAAAALAGAALASNPAPARSLTEVATAVRATKLVTVEIDTAVTVERGDESWRGDVKAKVKTPVRLLYGTDLSKMRADSVQFSAAGARGVYILRIPRPTRIATEVHTDQEAAHVETGWMRMRSRAGEYYLGVARKETALEARSLALLPEDAREVEEVTRQQVQRLVRAIVGEDAEVIVRFGD